MMAGMSRRNAPDGPVTIKKYANRRLYNTATSAYVTLDNLSEMVKAGNEFVVFDAKTGEDITRSVLAQIIFEMEGKSGQNLLPIRFLRQLIRFYGDSIQALVPNYLELSLEAFTRNRGELTKQISQAFTGAPVLKDLEAQIRSNMAMFERAIRLFSPFGAGLGLAGETEPSPAREEDGQSRDELDELKGKLDAIQRQLDSLTKKT